MKKNQIYKTLKEVRDAHAYSNLLEVVETSYSKPDRAQVLSEINFQMRKYKIEKVRIQERFK
jgi:hypothetical protein